MSSLQQCYIYILFQFQIVSVTYANSVYLCNEHWNAINGLMVVTNFILLGVFFVCQFPRTSKGRGRKSAVKNTGRSIHLTCSVKDLKTDSPSVDCRKTQLPKNSRSISPISVQLLRLKPYRMNTGCLKGYGFVTFQNEDDV